MLFLEKKKRFREKGGGVFVEIARQNNIGEQSMIKISLHFHFTDAIIHNNFSGTQNPRKYFFINNINIFFWNSDCIYF